MAEPGEEQRIRDVEEGIAAFTRGDSEAVLALFSDDIEIFASQGLGNSGSYRGHAGYQEWLAQWLEAWDGFNMEPRRIEAVGRRHVITETHQTARGRGSGVPVEQQMIYMFDVVEGKVVAMHLYPQWEQALEVARAREAAP